MRDADPVPVQVPGRNFLDARKGLPLDFAVTAEIDIRRLGKFSRSPPSAAALACAGAADAPDITDFTKLTMSSRRIRPFSPLPLTRPRSTPSSRANLRKAGLA